MDNSRGVGGYRRSGEAGPRIRCVTSENLSQRFHLVTGEMQGWGFGVWRGKVLAALSGGEKREKNYVCGDRDFYVGLEEDWGCAG